MTIKLLDLVWKILISNTPATANSYLELSEALSAAIDKLVARIPMLAVGNFTIKIKQVAEEALCNEFDEFNYADSYLLAAIKTYQFILRSEDIVDEDFLIELNISDGFNISDFSMREIIKTIDEGNNRAQKAGCYEFNPETKRILLNEGLACFFNTMTNNCDNEAYALQKVNGYIADRVHYIIVGHNIIKNQ